MVRRVSARDGDGGEGDAFLGYKCEERYGRERN